MLAFDRDQILRDLDFGRVDAESSSELDRRFVRTGDFDRFLGRDVQVVIGAKGTGKSALFELFAKYPEAARKLAGKATDDVIVVTGMGLLDIHELAMGDANEFRDAGRYDRLWRLYIALKAALALEDYRDFSRGPVVELLKATGTVADRRLLPILRGLWRSLVSGNAPSSVKLSAAAGGVEFVTQRGRVDVSAVLADVEHIAHSIGRRIWILFDKVDEFATDRKQRNEMVEGLLTQGRQIRSEFGRIQTRVFIRTDIWNALDMTNKSHLLDKKVELSWSADQLALLLIKGALTSRAVRLYLEPDIADDLVNGIDRMPRFRLLRALSALLPDKVYPGEHEADILNWIAERVTDGHGTALPRETILLGNHSRDEQLAIGGAQPSTSGRSSLISREAIRRAFRRVSEDRCASYFGEFPDLRPYLDQFAGKRKAVFTRRELETVVRGLQMRPSEVLPALYDIGVLDTGGLDPRVADRFEISRLYRQGMRLVLRGRP